MRSVREARCGEGTAVFLWVQTCLDAFRARVGERPDKSGPTQARSNERPDKSGPTKARAPAPSITHWALTLSIALLLSGTLAAATLETFVESGAGSTRRVLGYPVPLPIESQTPVDGFRSYASLHARHQALALASPDIEGHIVGQTFNGRPIWAYVLGDADAVRSDGEAEPAFLINGGIHAREWQTPEVATAIIERIVAGADGHGIDRFLLDESRIVVLPVHNIDGFLQTQRYPTQVLRGDDPTDREWPRDGRMRRKNMRNVDEILTTQGDHLGGIDLNRNHSPFWGGGSASVANLTYRGSAPGSEPESQALLAAARLGPESALRSFVDVHSYTRVLFVPITGSGTRDQVTNDLATLFLYAESGYGNNARPYYFNSSEPQNRGIGTTSEYFAYTFQVPSWTLELEPGENGSSEYGGVGASHDGFILPASQIARVRDSVSAAQRLLFYRMTGAAWLREVRLIDARTGSVVYDAGWTGNGNSRSLQLRRSLPLQAGQRYRLWLGFSKPMRLRSGAAVAQVPNAPELNIELEPRVTLLSASGNSAITGGRWIDHAGPPGFGYLRWQDDAWSAEFTLPAAVGGEFDLGVQAQDLSGEWLDTDPASPVRWAAGWIGQQLLPVEGDRQHRLRADPAANETLRLTERPRQIVEGDRLPLRLVRDGATSPARVRVRTESITADASDFVAFDRELVLPAGTAAIDFDLVTLEDLRGEPDKQLRLLLTAVEGTVADRQLDLTLVDNDNGSSARWVVRGDDLPGGLASAMSAANTSPRATAIDVASALQSATLIAAGETALPLVSRDLALDGHGLELTTPANARAFDVATGGRLTLTDVRLRAPAGAAVAGDGGLLRNAGSVELREVDLVDGRASRGGQLATSGSAKLERVRLVGGNADVGGAQLWSSGTLELRQSALLRAAGGNGALWSEGSALLQSTSIVESLASPALRLGGGSLRIGRSLLLNARNCATGAIVVSDGDNLDGDGSCALGGLTAGAAAATLVDVAGLPSPMPGGAALDAYGGDCGRQDLHGRARPQGAAARCDIGAVEAGIAPILGLWYDPTRDGSGFALELVGNLLFVIWYTYDAAGTPIAYTAQNELRGAQWSAALLRFQRAADGSISSSEVGSLSFDFASPDRAQAAFSFTGVGAGSGTLALQHLVFGAPRGALGVRGTWASPDYAFQGMSLIDQGEVLAAVNYFYDGSGALRWALGTAPARRGASIDLLRFTGSCPTCDYRPSASAAAGTLDLVFEGRDHATLRASVEAADLGVWTADTRIEAFR